MPILRVSALMLLSAGTAVAMPTAHKEVHGLEAANAEECIELVRTAKDGCIDCDASEFRKEIEDVFEKKCDEALGDHFLCKLCEECIAKVPADELDSLHTADEASDCAGPDDKWKRCMEAAPRIL